MTSARQSSGSAKSKDDTPSVDASMNVLEILSLHPGAADVLSAYGLHCHGCAFGSMDTLAAGAASHGLTDDDIDNIVDDLNDLLKNAPKKPAHFTLTVPAAEALREVAKQEGKETCILSVLSDGTGGFCMEFGESVPEQDVTFSADGVEGVVLCMAPTVLARIGGGAVDFRDGRFKLDLPQDNGACGCSQGNCSCASGSNDCGRATE